MHETLSFTEFVGYKKYSLNEYDRCKIIIIIMVI